MNRKALLIIWVLLGCSVASLSQEKEKIRWKASGIISGEYADFSVDYLGNTYLINASGQLKKIDAKGDSIGVFNDIKRYGKLHSIEISTPLKILLFYKDFGTIVILDRFLNPRATIDLRKHGYYQVTAIALAYDNQIWIYDALDAKLKKISEEGKMLSETPDFRVLFQPVPHPEIIIDQDKKLYVYDSNSGLLVFDYFGTLQHKLPFANWNAFTVAEGMAFGIKDKQLLRYAPGTLHMEEIPLPDIDEEAEKMVIRPWGVYFLTKNGIYRFDFQEK
jgi:hypothetical protein